MLRSALLIGAGIVAVLAFACAPLPPAPPPPSSKIGPRLAATCPDNTPFLGHVALLSAAYPGPDSHPYAPPSGVSPAYTWQTPLSDDLENAFLNAPPFFQQYLCGLNGIYVNASNCSNNDPTKCTLTGSATVFGGAWGFRSRTRGGDFGFRYIAISASDLWPNGGYARSMDDYETQVLQSFPGGSASKISNANSNSSWMSVLAALAHETGHVFWAEKTIPFVGRYYDFRWLINCNFFSGWNYNTDNDLRPKGRWRYFRDPMHPNRPDRGNAAGSTLDHSVSPYLANGLDSPNPGTANDALYQLYQFSQPWPSLFGAQTPEEDFVETYVMAVLTGYDPSSRKFAGPLTSLPIIIPGHESSPPDPVDDLVKKNNKPLLFNKIGCLPL